MSQQDVARDLVRQHGQTYAEQAGITLRDKPAPLFQLLVLTMLSSARIAADIAVSSTRELFAAGWRTPEKLRDASWQERVDALVRGGYRRHDESTSTQLENLATHVIDVHDGDPRRLRRSRTTAWTASSPRSPTRHASVRPAPPSSAGRCRSSGRR